MENNETNGPMMPADQSAIFNSALSNEKIKKIYSNGFLSVIGNGDIVVLLLQNGQPDAILNLSYTVTKTLALALSKMIQDIESATNNTIMTTNDVDLALQKRTK